MKLRPLAPLLLAVGLGACVEAPKPRPAPRPPAKEAVKNDALAPLGPEALAARAEQAWSRRADRGALEEAISTWEHVLEERPDDWQLLSMLSRAYFFLADAYVDLDGDPEALAGTFERGVIAGERAMIAASPAFAARVNAGDKVERVVNLIPAQALAAVYWYGANLGKYAVLRGLPTTLSYRERIHAVMQHVLNVDETFFFAAPHRYFGAYFAKAPVFAGGNLELSKKHFEQALELSPQFIGTKVLMAEYYATATGDRELFTRLLSEASDADPTTLPPVEPEQRVENRRAGAMLADIDNRF